MKQCFLCSQNLRSVDFRDTEFLRRFISGRAKIINPRYTGTCAKHQRLLARTIKRARVMGLLPFVSR